jgi:tetratricopeptide (TPR) repeat protein
MKENPYDIDYIEKYLANDLSDSERAAFEAQMKTDSVLAEEVALHRDVLIGLEAHFNNKLKHSLQDIELELRQEEKQKPAPVFRLNSRMIMAIAASFVVLLVAAYLLFNAVAPSNQELFATYYQPYPNIVSPIQRSEMPVAVNQGMLYYENGQFEVAIDEFSQQLAKDPANTTLLFYRGVSQLSLENPRAALTDLQQVVQLQDARFTHPAQWYISLAQLKLGNTAEASATLRQVAQSDSGYSQKAQQLLDDLD